VIDTGTQHIAYRQSAAGVFEGVEVKLGSPMTGTEGAVYYPVLSGLKAGDLVVASGSFLVDAETRLNPAAGSIYFGGSGETQQAGASTVRPSTPEDPDAAIEAALAQLSPEDRELAKKQRFCPILRDNRLGVMGVPVKLMLEGQPVFLCCNGCKARAEADPNATIAAVETLRLGRGSSPATMDEDVPPAAVIDDAEAKIAAALAELSPDDRRLAELQRFCAVLPNNRLGVMGPPLKLMIEGQAVFLCCAGCKEKALTDPKHALEAVAKLKQDSAASK
jgi:hypothetical protein